MMDTFLIVFDTETGGVLPTHPTISLGAVAVNETTWQEVDAFEVKIAFDPALADAEALSMNGYTAEAWSTAIAPNMAASRFASWMRPFSTVPMVSKRTGATYYVAKLAGYNALTFDLPRLKALFQDRFFPCAYLARDILQRALFYFDEHDEPKPDNMKLSTVAAYFGLDGAQAHDALADARLAATLLGRLRTR